VHDRVNHIRSEGSGYADGLEPTRALRPGPSLHHPVRDTYASFQTHPKPPLTTISRTNTTHRSAPPNPAIYGAIRPGESPGHVGWDALNHGGHALQGMLP
jgi:hypothetical protein